MVILIDWLSGSLNATEMLSPFAVHSFFPGVLPQPELFLNASSAREGDFVSARCKTPANISSIKIFFCKDGHSLAALKDAPHNLLYTFSFSFTDQSAGLYSCGYQKKDDNNQAKYSILSAPWKLELLGKNQII